MNKIVLHDAFVGQGCAGHQSPQPAVSVESGAMWIDAYRAVTVAGGRYVQGGGGTFGVLTKLTLRTRDLPEFFGTVVATIEAHSDTAFRDLVGWFVDFYLDQLFNPSGVKPSRFVAIINS